MSRNRFVKGKIYEFVEDHVTYFSEKSITEYSGINYIENSDTTIILGDNPENATSAALVDYYVKVRIFKPISSPPSPPATGASAGITSPGPSVVLTQYNGEYGFDWVDIDPISEEIQRIQDVDISNVEYFYKKGVSVNDLGDIVPKSSDETSAKTIIKENYKFSDSLKPCTNGRIDRPLVLIKPGQKISLSLEVNMPAGGTLTDEKIYLLDDDFYSFEMVNGTKDAINKRTEIKISADKDVVELKIKCLKESPSETKYTILQENSTSGKKGIPVGGFFMMENKVLKLKFRVIALVSDDGDPNAKAKALFDKFKTSKIKEYLNENSLNQAGYEVEIENYNEMSNADVDDYFYAFDKTDWTTKKYFANIIKQKPDVDAAGFCKVASWDPVKKECANVPVSTDTITEDDDIDNFAFGLYQEKLKKKIPSQTYEGGAIILVDFESPSDTSAFSRTNPLNNYKVFVYSTSIGEKDHYAHEIGHMLGLDHLFYTTKEMNSFNNSKNYYQTLKTNLVNKTRETYPFYIFTQTRAKIVTLKGALNNFIVNRRTYIVEKEKNVVQGRASNGIFTYNEKSVTKTQYLFLIQADIDKQNKYITENISAIRSIESNGIKDFEDFKTNFNILKNDSLKIDKEFIEFYEKEWEQMKSNYLRFKKTSTKNMMDYDNTRVVYLSHQIRIMRNDIKNY